jgi:hypothetical protein
MMYEMKCNDHGQKSTGLGTSILYADAKMMARFTELAKNASDAELVANIILDAPSNPSPHLRYLAGKNVKSLGCKKEKYGRV